MSGRTRTPGRATARLLLAALALALVSCVERQGDRASGPSADTSVADGHAPRPASTPAGTAGPRSLPIPYGSADLVFVDGELARHADSSAAWNRERAAEFGWLTPGDVEDLDVILPEQDSLGRGIIRIETGGAGDP